MTKEDKVPIVHECIVDDQDVLISRYGDLLPVTHVSDLTNGKNYKAIPSGNCRNLSSPNALYLKLSPGDIVKVKVDPDMDYGFIESIVSSNGDAGGSGLTCPHCHTNLNKMFDGVQCPNFLCKGRLVSRLVYAGGPNGLMIPPFTHKKCLQYVNTTEYCFGIDHIFDPLFGSDMMSGLGFTVYDTNLIRTSVKSLIRAIANYNSLKHKKILINKLLNTMSIPSLTPRIANTLTGGMIRSVGENVSTRSTIEETFDLIHDIGFLAEAGLTHSESSSLAVSVQPFVSEIKTITRQVTCPSGYISYEEDMSPMGRYSILDDMNPERYNEPE